MAKINHTASTRVLLASFDKNWVRRLAGDGHVEYIATANKSTVTLIVSGTNDQKLTFKKGQKILVRAGTFYFPPHVQVYL